MLKKANYNISLLTTVITSTLLLAIACSSSRDESSKVASVYNPNGGWNSSDRYHLSYCIDKNSFLDKYEIVRKTMLKSTEEWEKYADVKFQYVSKYDSKCLQSKGEVLFTVQSTFNNSLPRAYAFFPYSPASKRNLVLNMTKDLFDRHEETFPTLHSIVRHELGHVLGLEHAHDPSDSATAGVQDEYSIMYYPWVGRFGGWDKHPGISFWDKVAVNRLYPKQVFGFEDYRFNSATNWISENEQTSCPSDHLAYGLRCKDDYCGSVRLLCRKVPTDYFTQQTSSDNSVQFITGIACRGGHCSEVKASKKTVNTILYPNIEPTSECSKSIGFTDQSNDPIIDHAVCKQDEAMTKINCLDNKCDTITITCCPLSR